MGFSSIAQDVQGLSKRLGLSSDLAILQDAWENELGPLANWADILALENSILVVEARSHAVMQELSLRRRELLRRLNRHFPVPFLKFMTVRLGSHGR